MKPHDEREKADVNRREALSSLFLLGGIAALSGCSSGNRSPERQDGRTAESNTALTDLGDHCVLYADPPTGDPTIDTPALQAFFDAIEGTQKLGILAPVNANGIGYLINQTLQLPITGTILGTSTETHGTYRGTVISPADTFAGDILSVKAGAANFSLGQIGLRGNASQSPSAAAIRFNNTGAAAIRTCTFHDMLINEIGYGLATADSSNTSTPMRGLRLEHLIIETTGFAIDLNRTVGCILYDVVSSHVGIHQNTSQIRDIWLRGVDGEGGIYLEKVTSQYPGQNGIVIEGFLQVWGRHITGDEAIERCIWIKNCEQIFLSHVFASLGGSPKDGATPPVAFSMVIENDTLSSDTSMNGTNITLDQCHCGGATASASLGADATAGLFLKNVRHASVTNGTFLDNWYTGIRLENCENVSVTGALVNSPQGVTTWGIKMINSRSCSFVGNQFRNHTGWAIYADTCNEITIANNAFVNRANASAVYFQNGQRYTVTGNNTLLSGSGYGVYIYNSWYFTVSGNTIHGPGRLTGGTHYGIALSSSWFGAANSNSCHECQKGIIELGSSNYNVVNANAVSYNGVGWADAVAL